MHQPAWQSHTRGSAPVLVRRAVLLLTLLAIALSLSFAAQPVQADEGWTIERFHAEITIQPDASLHIVETIDVDFGALQKHGIFREIPVQYDYNQDQYRMYDLRVEQVTRENGTGWQYSVSRNGANQQIKIGDPDRTISGRQSYRISYRLQGALNSFDANNELYWNVNGGDWDVPSNAVSATVILPGGGLGDATCFEGRTGATEPCDISRAADRIEYRATRPFASREQLTIVAAIATAATAPPPLLLEEKPRTFLEYFDRSPAAIGAAGVVLLAGLGLLGRIWWLIGRDRRYTSLFYLTQDPREETRPLWQGHPVVVEYEPPEKLRPAELGLLVDERADNLDVTATIVDLAVRGYLSITEIPKSWFLGKKDWKLTRLKTGTSGLETYEALIIEGLFSGKSETKLSDLKNKFYRTLEAAQKSLYHRAKERHWFAGNPNTVRGIWAGIAIALIVTGVLAGFLLGRFFGYGFVGVVIVLLGVLLLMLSPSMVRRTAHGSELLRRTLGFREYIATAETDRQRFNEEAGIFAAYLPYAIVFGLVDRWANAFRDIDLTTATAGWYYGSGAFNAHGFSSDMRGFSSRVSSTIGSTPGSSGSSGFSGGSAGGGGGGGGGGSW